MKKLLLKYLLKSHYVKHEKGLNIKDRDWNLR